MTVGQHDTQILWYLSVVFPSNSLPNQQIDVIVILHIALFPFLSRVICVCVWFYHYYDTHLNSFLSLFITTNKQTTIIKIIDVNGQQYNK